MDKERINYLRQQFLSRNMDSAELQELKDMVSDPKLDNKMLQLAEKTWQMPDLDIPPISDADANKIYLSVIAEPQPRPVVRFWIRYAIIAAVLATIILGAGLFYFNDNLHKSDLTVIKMNDVAPGKEGATLTLADGKKILLSEVLSGNIANQSGVKISKTLDGQITYEIAESKSGKVEYNSLSTNRGEQTRIRLADGSLVFLNSASSIRYPTSFRRQDKRTVSLTGEGYFEIAKDKSHPFVVVAEKQEVVVLGTHFNINAYDDESVIKTTLLEGAVRINNDHILRPGELSLNKSGHITVQKANVSVETAWINNDFLFDNESLESVMRKLARWYDLSITYTDNELKTIPLSGHLSRTKSLSAVLNGIGMTTDLSFVISGRDVTISQK